MTRAALTSPLCKCGCGLPAPRREKGGSGRAFNKYVAGHYHLDTSTVPKCACGCGRDVSRAGRKWRKWAKGCHLRKHGFDAKEAKINERLLRVYGITRAAYEQLLSNQGGSCAICGIRSPGKDRTMWCVDHDHDTGDVRGLLCGQCNAGIGNLRDDPIIIERAAQYVRKGGFF